MGMWTQDVRWHLWVRGSFRRGGPASAPECSGSDGGEVWGAVQVDMRGLGATQEVLGGLRGEKEPGSGVPTAVPRPLHSA